MNTLIAISNGTDWATSIARQEYRLTGRPMIEIEDIADFILKVKDFCAGKRFAMAAHAHPVPHAMPAGPLSLLTVVGHGDFNGPYLGIGHEDQLTREKVMAFQGALKSMRVAFAANAEIVFAGCLVGTNPWLLADLSVAWGGIKVSGFTAMQKAGMPILTGGKVSLRGRTLVEAPMDIREAYRIEIPNAHRKIG